MDTRFTTGVLKKLKPIATDEEIEALNTVMRDAERGRLPAYYLQLLRALLEKIMKRGTS